MIPQDDLTTFQKFFSAAPGNLWNALGCSQAFHPLMIQPARWGGVYAVRVPQILAIYEFSGRDSASSPKTPEPVANHDGTLQGEAEFAVARSLHNPA